MWSCSTAFTSCQHILQDLSEKYLAENDWSNVLYLLSQGTRNKDFDEIAYLRYIKAEINMPNKINSLLNFRKRLMGTKMNRADRRRSTRLSRKKKESISKVNGELIDYIQKSSLGQLLMALKNRFMWTLSGKR